MSIARRTTAALFSMKAFRFALLTIGLNAMCLNAFAFIVTAVEFDENRARTETMFSGTSAMVGWTFYVTEPVLLTGLLWYGPDLDGLNQSHQVGLWKETSGMPREQLFSGLTNMTLLRSITIPAGSGAGLAGPVNYWGSLVNYVVLEPGGYQIAGTFRPGTDDIIKAADLSGEPALYVHPALQLGYPTFSFTDDFCPPESGADTYGVYVGPMLTLAIPEPAPGALIILATTIVVFARSRRTLRHPF